MELNTYKKWNHCLKVLMSSFTYVCKAFMLRTPAYFRGAREAPHMTACDDTYTGLSTPKNNPKSLIQVNGGVPAAICPALESENPPSVSPQCQIRDVPPDSYCPTEKNSVPCGKF